MSGERYETVMQVQGGEGIDEMCELLEHLGNYDLGNVRLKLEVPNHAVYDMSSIIREINKRR